jgi:hypothetical protein
MGEFDTWSSPHVTRGDWLPFERENLFRITGVEFPPAFYEARNLASLGYQPPKEWGWAT